MIANLHIQTIYANGVTRLKESYFTPPFKVADITEDKRSEWLQLMLMSSSPGILDGDQYNIEIDLANHSSLHLHTQSYQRLFNMKEGARQNMEVRLEKGSSFIFLPHPSVPHENSIFTARNKFYLGDSCNLIYGEVLTCGRKLSKGLSKGVLADLLENGEVFRFSSYRSVTEVFIHSKLIIKEHLFMQPSLVDPNKIGQLEGFTHQASLICIQPNVISKQEIVYEYLSQQEEIEPGLSMTAGNGLIVRLLGHKAEQLYDHLQQITQLLLQQKVPQQQMAYVG